MRHIKVLMLCLGLVGCASYEWVNPSNPNANLQSDNASCQNEATRTMPKPQPAYVNQPTRTNCNNFGATVQCNTTGGGVARVEDPFVVANYNERFNAYVENCLQTKGWREQKVLSVSGLPKYKSVDKSINMSDAGKEMFKYVSQRRKEICSSSEFVEISKKFPCDPRDIGDQIFDKSYPTKSELVTLKRLESLLQDLFNQEYQAYKSDTGQGAEKWRTLMVIYNKKEQDLFAQFYNGKMTWGSFNKERSRIYLERKKSF